MEFPPSDRPWASILLGIEPIVDAIIDPAMESPEHRIDVRRIELAKIVVFRRTPFVRKIESRSFARSARLRVDNHGPSVRISRRRHPAIMHRVVDGEFEQISERAKTEGG